jgi:AcrR family transcriptional regulator
MPDATPRTRKYDSPSRRQQAAKTRERIITAGREIVHGFPIWNWEAVTHGAVAERSAVSQRTVYRYFATEQELRDAVMEQLAVEARVDLETLRLEDLHDAVTRIIEYTGSFPPAPRVPEEPTIAAIRSRQREALVAAVTRVAGDWADRDRRLAAAMIDVLWTYPAYTTLVEEWGFDPKEAGAGVTWVIHLVEAAIRRGQPPET